MVLLSNIIVSRWSVIMVKGRDAKKTNTKQKAKLSLKEKRRLKKEKKKG